MRLQRRLERWMQAGLLTREQGERILAYENDAGASARWVVWAVASVGALAVVSGVVSAIASNWDEIPDGLKLGGGLLALVSLALAAVRLDGKAGDWPRDLCLLAHQLFVLGMIGLVGQVFHLSGHPWRAFALAAALAAPAAIVAAHSVLVDVALGLALLALGLGLDALGLWSGLSRGSMAILPLAAAVGLVLVCGTRLLARTGHEAHAAATKRWAIGLLATALLTATARWSGDDTLNAALKPVPIGLFVGALVTTGWLFWRPRIERNWLGAAALGAALVLGPELLAFAGTQVREVVGFLLSSGLCLLLSFAAASAGSRFGVNALTLALAGRIVWLFLELFDNLLNTGLGLIFIGFVLLGIAYGWWRLRGALVATPGRAEGGGA